MPAEPQSVIGNLADLRDDQVALPRFIFKRKEGLFVDLGWLESNADLQAAVDQIFSAGAYFLDLDYEKFIQLLYLTDPMEVRNTAKAGDPKLIVRFAADVVAFSPQRRTLYKAVKIGNGEAEYYFEPAYLETVVDEPVTLDGVVVDVVKKTVTTRTSLTFDEFVADMWTKGIRFGIDVDTVRSYIASGKSERTVIARRLEPVLGKAADIQELAKELHRDDAPKELPNGRLDLRQFKNRFPQINKGALLLKKIPRVMGTTGFEISGKPNEPPIPKDFELSTLSGPGTQVLSNAQGEFIVSLQDGFLNLDTKTNQISITEKIINREGVSAKTTGDLMLTGDEYEEHGEVQEKRLIEGNNIVMHADVFGTVSSRGGDILLKCNLVGGSALNQDGNITVAGVASGATLQAKNGTITLARAENCVVVGTKVKIDKAVNCDILAEEILINTAEGCALVGKTIALSSAGPRKQSEMLIFVPVPDLAEFDRKITALQDKIDEVEATAKKKSQDMETITSQPYVKKYLMVAANLKKGDITLTPEQQAGLQKLTALANPALRMVAKINAEIKQTIVEKQALAEKLELLAEHRKEVESGASCAISTIDGDILVRALKVTTENEGALYEVPLANLKSTLRGTSMNGEVIFSGRSGTLEWKYTAPE